MKIRKGNKFKIVKFIFYVTICLCFAYNIIFLLNTTITQKDYMKVFGITFLSMESDLMEDDLSKNDLIVLNSVNQKQLQEGDIIAYKVNGQTRINKIINIKNGYTTKSNKNYYPDIEKIEFEDIIGEKVVNMPYLGIVLKILQSKITSGFIFMLLIFNYLYNRYINIQKIERARKKENMRGN